MTELIGDDLEDAYQKVIKSGSVGSFLFADTNEFGCPTRTSLVCVQVLLIVHCPCTFYIITNTTNEGPNFCNQTASVNDTVSVSRFVYVPTNIALAILHINQGLRMMDGLDGFKDTSKEVHDHDGQQPVEDMKAFRCDEINVIQVMHSHSCEWFKKLL